MDVVGPMGIALALYTAVQRVKTRHQGTNVEKKEQTLWETVTGTNQNEEDERS